MQFQMTMKIHVTNWRETQENHQAMSPIEYNKGCVSARQHLNERRQSKIIFNTDFQSFLATNPAAMKKVKVKTLGGLFSGSLADISMASSLVQDHATLVAAYQHSRRNSTTGKYYSQPHGRLLEDIKSTFDFSYNAGI